MGTAPCLGSTIDSTVITVRNNVANDCVDSVDELVVYLNVFLYVSLNSDYICCFTVVNSTRFLSKLNQVKQVKPLTCLTWFNFKNTAKNTQFEVKQVQVKQVKGESS